MSGVGHTGGLEASGTSMDRNEYLRRASALEFRAADFVCSGLRAALLNVAARYRRLADQAVAWKADGKRERLQAVARQNAASEEICQCFASSDGTSTMVGDLLLSYKALMVQQEPRYASAPVVKTIRVAVEIRKRVMA
jgi:hypothetical protein